MSVRAPDPTYETILSLTKRRVAVKVTDADVVTLHRGMRSIDHRLGELTRDEATLARAKTQMKDRRVALAEERERIGALSDAGTVEKLLDCEVVHDARQGGIIFVRRRDTHEVISTRPVSTDERNKLSGPITAGPDGVDEKLAAALRLTEFTPSSPPTDPQTIVDEALASAELSYELKETLLALEETADDEPKPKKAKKEKTPKPAKEPKPKGKKKPAAEAPPAAPPAQPPADVEPDADLEPGPAEMEPDEPEGTPLPRRPPLPAQPPEADDASEDAESDASESEEGNTNAEDGAVQADDASASEADAALADVESEADAGPEAEVNEAAAPEADASDEIPEYETEATAPPEVEPTSDGVVEDPHPEAYEAGSEEEDEVWDTPDAPLAADPEDTAGSDEIPEYETEATAAPGAPAPDPFMTVASDIREEIAADPELRAAAQALMDEHFADEAVEQASATSPVVDPIPEPLAAPPPTSSPAPVAADPPDPDKAAAPTTPIKKAPATARKKAPPAAAPAPTTPPAAVEAPAASTPVAAVPSTPAPPPPPVPTGAPALLPESERNVGNNFGLSPVIAKKFGEAVVQFLGKAPMFATRAVETVDEKLGGGVTQNVKLAIPPMLRHLAAEGTIQSKPAGNDIIYFLTGQESTLDAWQRSQRAK